MDEPTIAFMLWLQDSWNEAYEGLSDMDPERVKRLHQKWVNEWLPSLAQPHCGDCTKVCMPCVRCHTEDFLAKAKIFADAINN
jgi:hypothetical protein